MSARLEELAEKCNEGVLTAEEHSEYENYVRVGNLFALRFSKPKAGNLFLNLRNG